MKPVAYEQVQRIVIPSGWIATVEGQNLNPLHHHIAPLAPDQATELLAAPEKSTPPEPEISEIVTRLNSELTQDLNLVDQRSLLMKAMDRIRKSGPVAPSGAEFSHYKKQKRLKNGSVEWYPRDGHYWQVKAKKAIFQNNNKSAKVLHLGTQDNAEYQDWVKRFERRRAIALLESKLTAIERQLQKLNTSLG